MPRLLRPPEARAKLGMKATQFDNGVRAKILPQPVELIEGERPIGFFDDELDSYVEDRRKARDQKPADCVSVESVETEHSPTQAETAACAKQPKRKRRQHADDSHRTPSAPSASA